MDKKDFLDKLWKELPKWEKNNLINKSTQKKIKSYYDKEDKLDGAGSDRFVFWISLIGSAFIALGIILFFASNWADMTDLVKTIVLILGTILIYGIGFTLYYGKNMPKVGEGLIFLGTIMYGLAVFLLMDIYDIGREHYQFVIMFIIGVLPIVYFTKFKILAIELVILFYWLLISYISDEYGGIDPGPVFAMLGMLGMVWMGMSRVHRDTAYHDFGWVYGMMGTLGIFGSFFLLTFEDILWGSNPMGIEFTGVFSMIMYGLFAIAIIAFVIDMVSKSKDDIKQNIGYVVNLVLLIGLYILFGFQSQIDYDVTTGVLIFMNVYFIALIVYMTYLGTTRAAPYLINISLFFTVVFIIAKYYDWFYDDMERSLFFILGGVILVGTSYLLERRRKKLIQQILD